MALLIWNDSSEVNVGRIRGLGELAFRLAGILGVLYICVIIDFLDQENSSSISQLIKGKSSNLQKLLKYFNEATTSVSNVL